MKNNFKSGVNATRKTIEIIKAAEAAKEIKQYGGTEVYKLMKAGQMYAIVVDGIVIGGAVSEADAKAAVEFLTHFTDGKVLDRNTLYSAGYKSMTALQQANDLIEAEKDGIAISDTYTIDGCHICNVADIITAKESGGLTDELFLEILKSRINKK